MTTSITSQPYSYYNVLNGSAASAPASTTTLQQELVPNASPATSNTGGTGSAVTPSSNSVLSPDVQALLQQILNPETSDEADPIAALLGAGGNSSVNALLGGGSTTSDAYNALVGSSEKAFSSNVYASLLTAAYQGAAAKNAGVSSNALDDIFANTNAANIAYNNAVQQQTKTVLAANNFGPNGVTPLTA